jgi:hypothetical protein
MDIPATLRCAGCDSALVEGASSCDFCGLQSQGQGKSFWQRVLWLVKAYRLWSLGVFVYALIQLAMLGHVGAYIMLFFILVPFGMALGVSYRMGDATSCWIVAFLILVDLGVIIAPEHQFLPMLNMFPQLPKAENRILTWYFLVYGMLQFVVWGLIVTILSMGLALSLGLVQ